MSADGSLRAVIVAFAQRAGANDLSDKRRQLARMPEQLTSLVARGRAVGAYKLSLEVFEWGLHTRVPSQAASAYGSGATHGPTAHVCAPAAITPAAKMLSAALRSRSATKPQLTQR